MNLLWGLELGTAFDLSKFEDSFSVAPTKNKGKVRKPTSEKLPRF
jgi:hypothetical protein